MFSVIVLMKIYFQLFSCILMNKINFHHCKIIQKYYLNLYKICTYFWQLIKYVKTMIKCRVWSLLCNDSSSTTVAEHKYRNTKNEKSPLKFLPFCSRLPPLFVFLFLFTKRFLNQKQHFFPRSQ